MSRIWIPPQRVRVVVVGVIRRGTEILAMEIVDRIKGQVIGYRPPGGEVDYGETSDQGLTRECREELDASVEVGDVLTIIENHYELNGGTGHEVVIVRDARFVDPAVYRTEEFSIIEPADEGGAPFIDRAIWVAPNGPGAVPMLPSGLA
ncbi:MAG: NUDIX domain-containing protein, partial [Proteobacteria bacterium]|nr:NUDIX domain-containing protein [Pseudomonadota bacterium]